MNDGDMTPRDASLPGPLRRGASLVDGVGSSCRIAGDRRGFPARPWKRVEAEVADFPLRAALPDRRAPARRRAISDGGRGAGAAKGSPTAPRTPRSARRVSVRQTSGRRRFEGQTVQDAVRGNDQTSNGRRQAAHGAGPAGSARGAGPPGSTLRLVYRAAVTSRSARRPGCRARREWKGDEPTRPGGIRQRPRSLRRTVVTDPSTEPSRTTAWPRAWSNA